MGELQLVTNMKLEEKIGAITVEFFKVSSHRSPRLFQEFLPLGYKETTLSSVDPELFEDVIYAKVCLGMLITLYDDLADNPSFYDPRILKELYKLNLFDYQQVSRNEFHSLAKFLFNELYTTLKMFPSFEDFGHILAFDIKQIFLANEYSELMTESPYIRNLKESRFYGPYNMGMVAAGMIDLMASPRFDKFHLGKVRELLIDGQRSGRIGNLLTTLKREIKEGDLTNELLLHPMGIEMGEKELTLEFEFIVNRLKAHEDISGVSVKQYVQGLEFLFHLHRRLEGTI